MVALADGEVEALLEVVAAVLLDLGGQDALVLLEQLAPAAVLHEAEEDAVTRHAVGGEPELVERVGGRVLALGHGAELGGGLVDDAGD